MKRVQRKKKETIQSLRRVLHTAQINHDAQLSHVVMEHDRRIANMTRDMERKDVTIADKNKAIAERDEATARMANDLIRTRGERDLIVELFRRVTSISINSLNATVTPANTVGTPDKLVQPHGLTVFSGREGSSLADMVKIR